MLETVIAWTVYVLGVSFVVIKFFVLPIVGHFFLSEGGAEVEDDDTPRIGFIHFDENDEWEELENDNP